MSKKAKFLAGIMAAGALAMVAGCEWEWSGDDDYWNERLHWVNFSGVYVAPEQVVIPADPPEEVLQTVEESLDGDAIAPGSRTFSGQLSSTPLDPGSLTITRGTEVFVDQGDGTLLNIPNGDLGSINYATGSYLVTFNNPAAAPVTARYVWRVQEEEETEEARKIIRRLTVMQDGNVLMLTDGSGVEYRGRMGRVETAGGDTSGNTGGTVIAHFEAEGNGIRMVGVFEGLYTPPADGAASGTMIDRVLRGTWFNGAGETGNMNFSAN